MYDSLDATGKLLPTPSPFAWKMVENLDHYRHLESARAFFRSWTSANESVTCLLSDEGIIDDLNKIDSAELRAAFWCKHNAEWEKVKISLNSNPANLHTCHLRDKDGMECGKIFKSYHALIVHQVSALGGEHGRVSPFYCCVLCNRCPISHTTFANLPSARNHLKSSFLHGYCKKKSIVHAISSPA